jgi:hypothetical protein
MPGGTVVLIVSADPERVERDLVSAAVPCPACGGKLRPWGHARARVLRSSLGAVALRPRRARCRSCGMTHVLLSDGFLVRRVDSVEVIGAALLAAAAGAGHRSAAAVVDRPAATVRGWLRRARGALERIRVHFTRWAHALDPALAPILPASSALAGAVEAIAVAARAASLALGPRSPWCWASSLSAGALLANTNCPWPEPWNMGHPALVFA